MAIYTLDGRETDSNTKEPLDLRKTDFFGLMAHSANMQKGELIGNLLELVKKGDSSAIKLLEKALLDKAPVEEKNKPIPILMGITQKNVVSK